MTNQRQRRCNDRYYPQSSVNDREGFPSEEEIGQEPRSIVSTQPQPGGSVQYTSTTSFGPGGYYPSGGSHGYSAPFGNNQGPYTSEGLAVQQSISTSGSRGHSYGYDPNFRHHDSNQSQVQAERFYQNHAGYSHASGNVPHNDMSYTNSYQAATQDGHSAGWNGTYPAASYAQQAQAPQYTTMPVTVSHRQPSYGLQSQHVPQVPVPPPPSPSEYQIRCPYGCGAVLRGVHAVGNLTRHMKSKRCPNSPKEKKEIPCPYEGCEKSYARSDGLQVHMRKHHGAPAAQSPLRSEYDDDDDERFEP